MAANQVDFKILPSDQFSVYSPQTRSDKVITYFTLLSKLRGDILSVGQDDDPNDIVSAFYSSVGGTQTLHLVKADGSEVTASVPEPTVGTVTSVDLTASTGISVSGGPITTSGSITVTNTAPDQVVVLTGAGTTSISGTYPSFTITSNDQFVGTVTSVGLTMPAAFSVANSPVTASGTLAVTAAGLSSQYIRGDGQLANFPTPGGGGSSVNYYLNGSVSQGTFGGDTYYELSKTPIAGAGTNFTRAHGSGDGYIASFITDANDPDLINIPGGNWPLEFYFNSSSSGGSPAFYGELYKVSVSNVFTLIASGSVNPESITGGTTVDQYYTSIAIPQTALLSTDRLAIRVYVIVSGKNITLHTENSNFSEVITTFSTGLNSLNGLSDQVQYFAVGTSGTDFEISSSLDTHTFNLPTASATNRGALSSADWSTFSGKQNALTLTTTGTTGAATLIGDTLNIPSYADQFVGTVTSVDLTAGTGITVSGGPITTSGSITVTNNDRGSSQNIFKNIAVAGQSTIVADVNDDTLTVAAGSGVTITTNDTTDTITISATGSGGSVTSVGTSAPITGGTITTTGTIGITQSGAAADGYLSSTDWNTFNNKQNALTNPVTGTGTTNYVSKFTSSSAIGDSAIYDNAGNIGIGTSSPLGILTTQVSGTFTFDSNDNDYSRVGLTLTTGTNVLNQVGSGIVWTAAGGRKLSAITNYVYADSDQSGLNFYVQPTSSGSIATLTEAMRITSAGNVGIGTTSPNYKLSVDDNTITTAPKTVLQFDAASIADNGGYNIDFRASSNDAADRYVARIRGIRESTGALSQLSFWTESGSALLQRMTIRASGNIGIGNTAPSQILHVSGNIRVTGAYYDSGNSAGTSGQILSSTATGTSWIAAPSGGGISGSGTANYVTKWTSASAIGDSVIYDDGTNVGIGNTAPNQKLELSVGNAVTGGLRINYSAAATSEGMDITYLNSGNTTTSFDSRYNSDSAVMQFRMKTASTAVNAMTILGNGNIGIGTTAPTNKLDIAGSLTVGTSKTGNTDIEIKNSSNSKTHYVFSDGTTGELGIESGASVGIKFNTSGANTRMVIASTGNVGIGTTSPAQKLDVVGNAKISTDILLGTAGVSNNIYFADATSTQNVRINSYTDNTLFFDNFNGQYNFRTTNSYVSRLYIANGGNVGIGIDNPGAKLTVFTGGTSPISGTNDGIRLQVASYNTSARNTIAWHQTGSDLNLGRFGLEWNSGTSQMNFVWRDVYNSGAGVSELMRLQGNGNLGIGNTAPSQILHVTGNIRVTGAYYDSSNAAGTSGQILSSTGTGTSWIAAPSGGGISGSGTANYVTKWTSGSAVGDSSIYDNGNVGIGTTAPAQKLQIGDGTATGSQYFRIFNSASDIYIGQSSGSIFGFSANSAGFILSDNASFPFGIGTIFAQPFVIGTNNAERMRITSAGNVGIGTTNPTSKLYIEGGSANWNETTPGLSVGTIHLDPGVTTNDFGNAITFGASDYSSGDNAQAGIYVRSDGAYGTKMYFATSNSYVTGSKTRMYISEGGSVGIGTTSPSSTFKVTVNSGTNINSFLNGDKISFSRTSDNVAGVVYLSRTNDLGANGTANIQGYDGIQFRTQGPESVKATITSAGNVGIGTTAPGALLQVGYQNVTTDALVRLGVAYASNRTSRGGITWQDSSNTTGKIYTEYDGTMVSMVFGSLYNSGYNSNNLMIIRGNGNVGIGTTGPSSKLHVAGDARITSGSLGVGVAPNATDGRIDASNDIVAFSSSDLRLKENIKPIENALEKVKSLTGVEFDWKPELKHAHGYEGHDTGVIAQEVQEVMPTAIRTNDTGYLAVRYEKLIGLLIEGMKEQQLQIDELKSKLK